MNFLKLHRFARIGLLAMPLAFCPARAADDVVSIDFPGGPISKLVTQLGKENKVSIITSVGLDPVLPAFSLHDVHIQSMLVALGQLLEPDGYRLVPTGVNVAVLTQPARHTSQDFTALRLEGITGSRSVEDIVGAIQAACEFAHPDEKASTLRIKYHPGTKLLFVAGTERDVTIANRVVSVLPPDAASRQPILEKK